jgi:hypothetical protein
VPDLILALAATMMSVLANAEDSWLRNVSPYLWMAGTEGAVETKPRLSTVNVDSLFSYVWDRLDTAIFAKGEIPNGKIGVIADLLHIRIA